MNIIIIISLIIAIPLSVLWVKGIDYMVKNHPNYKGNDFLNWDDKDEIWDDNTVHTEGEIGRKK